MLPPAYLADTIEFLYIPRWQDKSFLHQKYVVERLTAEEVAAQIFSAKSTVLKHLKAHGIPVREPNPGVRRRRLLAYGQRVQGRRLIAHHREQECISKMLELRSKGFTYQQIADALNSLKVPTKTRCGKWHRKTVHAILRQVDAQQSN